MVCEPTTRRGVLAEVTMCGPAVGTGLVTPLTTTALPPGERLYVVPATVMGGPPAVTVCPPAITRPVAPLVAVVRTPTPAVVGGV